MKVDETIHIAKQYHPILENLKDDDKVELAAWLLSKVVGFNKEEVDPESKSLSQLFGAFESDLTADEMAEDIRNSRNFTREEIDLD